jgi:hypothetical protein
MRPWQGCLERKSFSLEIIFGSAKLFTAGCGELFRGFLAVG